MKFDFLWRRAKQFRGELALISILSLFGSAVTLTIPWLAGQLLGGVVEGATASVTNTLALLIVALVSLTAFTIAANIASQVASLRILTRLRLEAYEHVQLMPMEFHDREKNGDLLALMTYEVGNLSSFLASTLTNVPSMVATAGGAIIVLFLLDPAMALVVPILVPVFYVLMKLVGRRMRIIAGKVRQAEVALISQADSDLNMLPAIKAFAGEEHHRSRYFEAAENSRRLSIARARISAFISPIVGLIAALAAIGLLIWGSGQLESGAQTPSELFAFLLYAALLTRPIGGLADIYGQFQIARGTLARLEAVLTMDTESGYREGKSIERAKGAIDFGAVTFGYPGRPTVLDGLSLSITPGEIVALTGDNGVGKSTLVRLLLRFYHPQAGRITLDGSDIADIQLQELRRQFGYVPQRALLFNGTIRDNVTFGQISESDAAQEQAIERALQLAQASEFIAELPQGIETEIGDDGVRLSGGQRQRIALARALLRDPPIYILDEATSMYDLESEAEFVEDCLEALQDRTVIIITHRPASLALADRVLKVTESGVSEVDKAYA